MRSKTADSKSQLKATPGTVYRLEILNSVVSTLGTRLVWIVEAGGPSPSDMTG